ncbi:hypothetical protein FRC96_07900 [Lujinxingia vulgaris]|uniref:Carboxypeptidase regulatory-like domain-containing protein n=1 Tax=Lujinxingia vulgaris TaxID=2600176 RepID=A0A5C6XF15_9DELT|nr:hypothetical protein [Lujinxingia vulgaris]TXD37957.1 hypothetical protein FRC96_07900 [Lujinxingia vulgaris]
MQRVQWMVLFVFLSVLSASACERTTPYVAPGEVCDPADDDGCMYAHGEMECRLDATGTPRCLRPLGGVCDVSDSPSLCGPGASCVGPEARGSGYCLLDEFERCDIRGGSCGPGLACESADVVGRYCNKVLYIQGQVFDTQTLAAVEGAQVIAFDEEGVALNEAVFSDASGLYRVPIAARRDAQGMPVHRVVSLHVSAPDYHAIPGGLRTIAPLDLATARIDTSTGELLVDTAQTDVAMLALPLEERGFASIRGKIEPFHHNHGGRMVAYSHPSGAFRGVSDRYGAFTIFNVPPGRYQLQDYSAHTKLKPAEIDMGAVPLEGVAFERSYRTRHSVEGQVRLVDALEHSEISVSLVVASTFDAALMRGEMPPALRASSTRQGDTTWTWRVQGVPPGVYDVLVTHENDGLVVGSYDAIFGDQRVRIQVPEGEGHIEVTPVIRVTAALPILSPGAEGPQGLSARPYLLWGPAPNVDHYDLVVFDDYGKVVWEALDIAPGEEGDYLSVAYDGPFQPGMYYQFRVTAYRSGSRVTSTEALRGVFYRE